MFISESYWELDAIVDLMFASSSVVVYYCEWSGELDHFVLVSYLFYEVVVYVVGCACVAEALYRGSVGQDSSMRDELDGFLDAFI